MEYYILHNTIVIWNVFILYIYYYINICMLTTQNDAQYKNTMQVNHFNLYQYTYECLVKFRLIIIMTIISIDYLSDV